MRPVGSGRVFEGVTVGLRGDHLEVAVAEQGGDHLEKPLIELVGRSGFLDQTHVIIGQRRGVLDALVELVA